MDNNSINNIPIVDNFDKQFERNRKWTVFAVWSVVELIYFVVMSTSFPSSLSGGQLSGLLFYLFVIIISTYISSYIATKGIKRRDAQWKNILELILRIIGTIFIMMIVGIGVFFAGCLLIALTGGLRYI